MTFYEDSRLKTLAVLRFVRLGHKYQSLEVTRWGESYKDFTNTDQLRPLLGKKDLWVEHQGRPEAPRQIILQLGLNDLYLSKAKSEEFQKELKPVLAGHSLINHPQKGIFLNEQRIYFSQHFTKETLKHWQAKGYQIESAIIEQIIIWYCKEDEQEYRVVIPRIILTNENG